MRDSRPILQYNIITNNEGIGLYLRDISKCQPIKKNTVDTFCFSFVNAIQFRDNLIEVSCEKNNLELDDFLEVNFVFGDIDIPDPFKCTLI